MASPHPVRCEASQEDGSKIHLMTIKDRDDALYRLMGLLTPETSNQELQERDPLFLLQARQQHITDTSIGGMTGILSSENYSILSLTRVPLPTLSYVTSD